MRVRSPLLPDAKRATVFSIDTRRVLSIALDLEFQDFIGQIAEALNAYG
jgi:acyl carrier protein phosphodiesterase